MRAAVLDQRITSVSYDWDGEDNASQSVQRVNGAVVRRSLPNNPRFTRTSGTVEVRRNLHPSPIPTATDHYIQNAGGTQLSEFPTVGGPDGSGVWRKAIFSTPPTASPVAFSQSSTAPVTEGATYTYSAYIISDYVGFAANRIEVLFYNSSGGLVLADRTTQPALLSPNVWERRYKTLVTPAGATSAKLTIAFSGPQGMPTGAYIGYSKPLIEATTILRPYFDGSYSPDPDLTPVWVGTANASQSYLRGFVPGNIDVNGNTFLVASQNNGMRIIPRSTASNESPVFVGGSVVSLSGNGVTFTPGKWYGFQAVCTLLAPQTGTLIGAARRIQLVSNNVAGWTGSKSPISVQPPNEAGSYQEELVAQLPADSVWAILRLYNGAYFGNGDVYWDKLLIVEGDTEEDVRRKLAQGYFDGDTQVNAETINRVKL